MTSSSDMIFGIISIISAISLATIGSIELLLLIESASVDELIVFIGASFAEYILRSTKASTLDRLLTNSLNKSLVLEYLCG